MENEINLDVDENKKIIYTDFDMTKNFIWSAYDYLKESYEGWEMVNFLKRNDKCPYLKLRRSSLTFLLQIKTPLLKKDIEKDFPKDSVKKIKLFYDQMEKGTFNPTPSQFHFIRIFAEDFMDVSGMKNISRVPKTPDHSLSRGRGR